MALPPIPSASVAAHTSVKKRILNGKSQMEDGNPVA